MHEAPHSTQGTGLAPNVAGALSYLLGPITGVLFLVLEKHNPFVRFHAAQSIVLSVAWVILWVVLTVVNAVLSVVPIIGWIIGILLSLSVGLAGLGLWLFLMYKAFGGNEWEVPVVGAQARRLFPTATAV
jgi:uncharacterized membrane protein